MTTIYLFIYLQLCVAKDLDYCTILYMSTDLGYSKDKNQNAQV